MSASHPSSSRVPVAQIERALRDMPLSDSCSPKFAELLELDAQGLIDWEGDRLRVEQILFILPLLAGALLARVHQHDEDWELMEAQSWVAGRALRTLRLLASKATWDPDLGGFLRAFGGLLSGPSAICAAPLYERFFMAFLQRPHLGAELEALFPAGPQMSAMESDLLAWGYPQQRARALLSAREKMDLVRALGPALAAGPVKSL